jgi:hypothetical protein
MNIQIRRILGLLSSSRSDWIGLHGMRCEFRSIVITDSV